VDRGCVEGKAAGCSSPGSVRNRDASQILFSRTEKERERIYHQYRFPQPETSGWASGRASRWGWSGCPPPPHRERASRHPAAGPAGASAQRPAGRSAHTEHRKQSARPPYARAPKSTAAFRDYRRSLLRHRRRHRGVGCGHEKIRYTAHSAMTI
jgi:hypothetical protein